jgi:2-C-methyl-D-erythritol 4-phosphate cytidylyltransferase / 2-C-methyl-D-erythritol 2,4-cyclodiphosphate synthase
LAGLEALAVHAPDRVLIHDGARPFVSGTMIDAVIDGLSSRPGAIAAEPVADTLKHGDEHGVIDGTVDRTGVWRAQTPQGFHFEAILDAHRRAVASDRVDFTDDASIAEWAGMAVGLVRGSPRNVKLTTREDLQMAEQFLSGGAQAFEPRTGTGFDVHRFGPGDHVWLCGVKIPHSAGLVGHSDADAPLHALTDAVLGALGDGDIGAHFPPSDAQWKGAPSRQFAEDAAKRVAARGGRISNVDVTILAEEPRIGPHRDAMRRAVSEMFALSVDRVGVKATTMERMGFVGRGEGLGAMASATILLPL